ncbi:UNVERIFIED_CONTAM: hypothetical protein FKN15_006988 [Acipenser sinensis]
MFPWWLLSFLALCPASLCTNPGITGRITQNGLEYGRQIGIAVLQQKLKSIKIPDMSGKEKVSPIGKVRYSLTEMQIVSVSLPKSAVGLSPGTGVVLSIGKMFPWWLLSFLALCPASLCTNPGITGRITQNGLEYGRQIGIAVLQQKLKSIKIPDMSGKEKVSPIGKVRYSLTEMQIVSVSLPKSAVGLSPGTGVVLSIGNAYISIKGNWRVKYLRIVKDHGSFDLSVRGLTISTGIGVSRDETGRPTVSSASCSTSIGGVRIKFHGGASWLYNLFSKFIEKALRKALSDKICPLVSDAIGGLNPHLKTLNVLAKVDRYAEVEYSLVSPPVITKNYIDLDLKGEFYNIGQHREPPFTAPPFSLPEQASSMLYIGVSEFTLNSAGFVYYSAGVLNTNVTDDMDYVLIGTDVAFTGSPARYSDTAKARYLSSVYYHYYTCLT